jgi:hypothetical protein
MITLALAAFVLPVQVSGHIPSHAVTESEIRASYRDLIRVKAVAPPGTADTMLLLSFDSVAPAQHLLSAFYQQHLYWFTYLVQNGRGFSIPGLDELAPGVAQAKPGHPSPSELTARFNAALARDSVFNSLMIPAIAGYLRSTGVRVASNVRSPAAASVPIDTVMRVAVRFFDPDLIMNGRIWTHVCTSINAVRELPGRNLGFEAFSFGTIIREILRGDSSSIEPDFAAARALVNALDSPARDSVRLQRAQGVMWGTMATSPRLRSLLLASAARDSVILPFRLSN